MIFYFSFFIQIFYYLGIMQWFIFNLGRILQSVVGTSICESVTCAGNIFLGMVGRKTGIFFFFFLDIVTVYLFFRRNHR